MNACSSLNKDGQTDQNEQLDWQTKLIDRRLLSISKNPERIWPIEKLMRELEQSEEE